MSTATTNAGALAEFLGDLQRLNPKHQDFLNAVDEALVTLQENSSQTRSLVQKSVQGFLLKKQAELEAHVDADLAVKEAVRGAFGKK